MRSIWKGHIRFSLVTIPIEVYNAVETGNNVKFRQLHAADHGPVGYDKVCRTCNNVLKSSEIIKGYEYEPDQYAIIEIEDLKNIKLKSTRVVEIEAFIKLGEVHPLLFEQPYFVAPNGDIGKKSYALLRDTLNNTKRAAVGRIILRDREDVVMVTPHENGLVMYKLRFPYEIRSIKDVPSLDMESGDKEQIKLAETLVASMSKSIDEVDFSDRYRDAVMELIDQKIQGKEIATVSEGEDDEKPVVDIMEALKASIAQAKKKSA